VGRPNPRARVYKAVIVQDGHSLGEQAVYDALWKLAEGDDAATRTVTIGYDKLAKFCRLNEKSVRGNIRSLVQKLAIEVIGAENSAIKQGKTYRVYGFQTVLERRKTAGLEWVIRNKGVRFVPPPADTPTVVETPTVVDTPTGSVVERPTVTVGVSTTVFNKEVRQLETSSTSVVDAVRTMATRFRVLLSADAAQRLVHACRTIEPQATDEDIGIATWNRLDLMAKRRQGIANPTGWLLAAVPEFLETSLADIRAERTTARGREPARPVVLDVEGLKRVLYDPEVSEESKQIVREQLKTAAGP
jgi:hypothetical protein